MSKWVSMKGRIANSAENRDVNSASNGNAVSGSSSIEIATYSQIGNDDQP